MEQAAIERSSLERGNVFEMRPAHLLCVKCLLGGAPEENFSKDIIDAKNRITDDNDVHIRLVTAFDEVGARTKLYDVLSLTEKKRDLDVLCAIGLAPGDTRTARDLLYRIQTKIPKNSGICEYGSVPRFVSSRDAFVSCPMANGGFFEKGCADLPYRCAGIRKEDKERSVKAIAQAKRIKLRPHHILCIVCFTGASYSDKPLADDNLYEVWHKMKDDPDIEIEIVDGPGECMVCPPCHGYIEKTGLCVCRCHLRDRKKDLEAMLRLGIAPGDVITARELAKRVYEFIPDVKGICRFGGANEYEWADCAGPDDRYTSAVAKRKLI